MEFEELTHWILIQWTCSSVTYYTKQPDFGCWLAESLLFNICVYTVFVHIFILPVCILMSVHSFLHTLYIWNILWASKQCEFWSPLATSLGWFKKAMFLRMVKPNRLFPIPSCWDHYVYHWCINMTENRHVRQIWFRFKQHGAISPIVTVH